MTRAILTGAVGVLVALSAASAHAEDARPQVMDRVAVRFVAPELGGATRPAYVTERELAFLARLEALFEDNAAPYVPQDRFLREALDRQIARTMLGELLVQRGIEPPDLIRVVDEARAELSARVGGEERLVLAMRAEGIDEIELKEALKRRARAAYYVDRVISPILNPTDDEAKEAFRALPHPFKSGRYEDTKAPFLKWLIHERMRAAELEFYQVARTKVRIVFPSS